MPDPATLKLKGFPNSVDTLAPNNRFVLAINKVPITPGIPYYTIVGDRGRGDTPKSSDGVVPYWSSHLDGAGSEFIAPCNHSSPLNPQAIAEVHRILKLNAPTKSRRAAPESPNDDQLLSKRRASTMFCRFSFLAEAWALVRCATPRNRILAIIRLIVCLAVLGLIVVWTNRWRSRDFVRRSFYLVVSSSRATKPLALDVAHCMG